ncbi:hypothetical protein DNHGIG_13920 [Collibacillus ludicampi]|uniref:SIR2-like domain-containing protein n=1 Tax=Collibacillus ludicampi TaxID=2771369 RepID=A0AAV4LDV7_9BACL|nr:hypothetical protein [Collibacillus ludicampi]GIM45843.1 hypothetical protein DNHGIG_13920 [Collibacillus ludicampi]
MTGAKISLFFGAGAEIGYGLPSGGKFALDLFRTPVDEDKAEFRKQLEKINNTSTYAVKWLPNDYQKKRVHVFGRGDYEAIVASSLENRREEILSYLDNFDHGVHNLLKNWHISEDELRAKFKKETDIEIGDILYGQAVKLNNRLADSVKLFESSFFSAMLKTLESNPEHRKLQRTIRAILELLVGSCGQRLISKLNEELFESAPERLSVFDDLSGIFSLDYRNVGQTGMEIVLEEKPHAVSANSSLEEIMAELGRTVLEDIYSKSIDYQALIDSHFRYLYNPKAHWAKFTRISIFLHTVRRYISSHSNIDPDKIANGPGYYHDLLSLSKYATITAIGTTNYNSFAEQVLDNTTLSSVPVFHLNGSVSEFYDPYCNNILINPTEQQLASYEHIVVPFIFTQSGIKPLTSITMSKRYVELYDKFRESDIICIIGYGFNGDDGHINGLFRSLAVEGKRLAILHYGNKNESTLKKEYQAKLRLLSSDNLDVFTINDDRLNHGKI